MQWSFFFCTSNALFNEMLRNAMNVLDKTKNVASFFYLYKYNKQTVDNELAKAQLDIKEIEILAKKLSVIRNRTHFHLDKEDIFDPNRVWKDADLTGNFFSSVMDKLWMVLNSLYAIHFDHEFKQPIYKATDIERIIEAVKEKGIRI